MWKSIISIIFGLAFGFVALWIIAPSLFGRAPFGQRLIEVAGQKIYAEVAETEGARQLGLGGRRSLDDGHAMLFVFPEEGAYGFWMKDMRFAIDIVWVAADGTIVTIKRDISPDTYPQVFTPTKPARYVIELPSGFSEKYGLKTGNEVKFLSKSE